MFLCVGGKTTNNNNNTTHTHTHTHTHTNEYSIVVMIEVMILVFPTVFPTKTEISNRSRIIHTYFVFTQSYNFNSNVFSKYSDSYCTVHATI